MIEALACGTPVVAWRCGSVPEIIEDGKTGFIVESIEEAVSALDKVESLDRNVCRKRFEERFTAKRMAEEYIRVYQKLTSKEALLKAI
jgi:glycosyltransferase involved in cell wall biosynthesis